MAKSVTINSVALRVFMARMGINQRELAGLSGISEQTLIRLQDGRPFGSETLGKLADALNVHPADLIDAKGFSSPLVDAQAV